MIVVVDDIGYLLLSASFFYSNIRRSYIKKAKSIKNQVVFFFFLFGIVLLHNHSHEWTLKMFSGLLRRLTNHCTPQEVVVMAMGTAAWRRRWAWAR